MPHIHEKIDWTVGVFIVYKNKVLLRLHDKYNKWLAVGGHVELDEEANTAAIREVKEEVGLDIELIPPPHWDLDPYKQTLGIHQLIPPHYMNIHQINDAHQHLDLIIFRPFNYGCSYPGERKRQMALADERRS